MVKPNPAAFLFVGKDSYSKEEAIKKIAFSVLGPEAGGMDYKVFDGADAVLRDILDYVSTVPFSAPKRLAVIKNFGKFSKESRSRLIDYIKNPHKSACIILDCEDDSVIKEDPQILRYISLSRFGELAESQFHARASQILSSAGRGKEISSDAAMALKEIYADDMGSVSQELHKLASFAGERNRIEVSDVEALTGKNPNASAFDLTDAIEAGDVKAALSIVSELIISGKKHYEIIGLLYWQVKRLLKGRILLAKGESDTEIAAALKINRRYYDRFSKSLKASSESGIESKIGALLDADLAIKAGKYDPKIALEFAVIKLCLGGARG